MIQLPQLHRHKITSNCKRNQAGFQVIGNPAADLNGTSWYSTHVCGMMLELASLPFFGENDIKPRNPVQKDACSIRKSVSREILRLLASNPSDRNFKLRTGNNSNILEVCRVLLNCSGNHRNHRK